MKKTEQPDVWREDDLRGVLVVVLSAAKDLARRTQGPFAALSVTRISTCLEPLQADAKVAPTARLCNRPVIALSNSVHIPQSMVSWGVQIRSFALESFRKPCLTFY